MSNHVFSLAPQITAPRSTFKRPFQLKTTIDTDYLYPIYCDEVLPGDSVKFKFRLLGRLSTPLVPIMDRLFLDTFFFFVPNRLIDKDWKKLMGERPFGDLSIPVTAPKLNTGEFGVAVGSLSDYIGIPPSVPNLDFLPYWHRAYNLIWNEWFRPEYICPAVKVAGVAEDGTVTDESLDDYVLLKRAKRLDYFTGANPFPQVGESVTIPLGASVPVVGNGIALGLTDGTNTYGFQGGVGGSTQLFYGSSTYGKTVGTASSDYANVSKAFGVTTDAAKSGLVADLSSASAITINALRNAFAAQHYLEALARSGSRYIEILRGVFNVISPDQRLQRPEYLGGSSTPLDITTVPQTSSTDATSPQGNLAAFATVSTEGFFSQSFTEHGVIIGLANVRADLSYQQGLPRMFSRSTRFDWYLPQFANVGEQAILNKEIYAQGPIHDDDDGDLYPDDDVFGYQEAWAEYRYHPHMITGKFRSVADGSLDYWHLAQFFEALPQLDPDFVLESVPIDRCLAVQDEPALILAGAFDSTWSRPMPLYSVPGMSRL